MIYLVNLYTPYVRDEVVAVCDSRQSAERLAAKIELSDDQEVEVITPKMNCLFDTRCIKWESVLSDDDVDNKLST